jgi:hypothetical protein
MSRDSFAGADPTGSDGGENRPEIVSPLRIGPQLLIADGHIPHRSLVSFLR